MGSILSKWPYFLISVLLTGMVALGIRNEEQVRFYQKELEKASLVNEEQIRKLNQSVLDAQAASDASKKQVASLQAALDARSAEERAAAEAAAQRAAQDAVAKQVALDAATQQAASTSPTTSKRKTKSS